ncbi:MAG: hypothetical protein F4037_03470 [Gemmatimonadales bacterium]|nr:hypothetical protein [Gemmatimonadales bacterium]MYK01003.1 hypothetical protein [Candidatus Palauibacter ramosifaciens]
MVNPTTPSVNSSAEFGVLTGDWAGWCCADLLDAAGQWYLILDEGSSGDVTGTVEDIEVGGPRMRPTIVSGTVSGRRSGAAVSLGFHHDDGRRGSFTEQSSETAFITSRLTGCPTGLMKPQDLATATAIISAWGESPSVTAVLSAMGDMRTATAAVGII